VHLTGNTSSCRSRKSLVFMVVDNVEAIKSVSKPMACLESIDDRYQSTNLYRFSYKPTTVHSVQMIRLQFTISVLQ